MIAKYNNPDWEEYVEARRRLERGGHAMSVKADINHVLHYDERAAKVKAGGFAHIKGPIRCLEASPLGEWKYAVY